MTSELLPAIEIETGTESRRHGDLAARPGRRRQRLVAGRRRRWACRARMAVRFLFPHAPVMPVTINNGMRDARVVRHPRGRPQRARRPGRRAQVAGAGRGADRARSARAASPPRRIVLAGFSQGGAIALYAGLRHAAAAGRHRRAVDLPDRRARRWRPRRRRPIATCRSSWRTARRIRSSQLRVGRDVAARAGRRRLERRMAHVSDGARGGARGNRRVRRSSCAAVLGRPTLHRGVSRAGSSLFVGAAGCVLRRDAAPRQRVAQQELDLRVGAAQLGLGQALDLGPQGGIDAQQEGLSSRPSSTRCGGIAPASPAAEAQHQRHHPQRQRRPRTAPAARRTAGRAGAAAASRWPRSAAVDRRDEHAPSASPASTRAPSR